MEKEQRGESHKETGKVFEAEGTATANTPWLLQLVTQGQYQALEQLLAHGRHLINSYY